jgi:superfamily II DNA or RNA helicase
MSALHFPNLQRSNRFIPRSYQQQLIEILKNISENDFVLLKMLFWVVPGGGKSALAGFLLERFPTLNIAWYVPRLTLLKQADKSLMENFGIEVWQCNNKAPFKRSADCRGFIASQDSLTENPTLHADEISKRPYIILVDECHHAKIFQDGTQNKLAAALDRLYPLAKIMGFLTGTLETHDRSFIWGMKYNKVANGEFEVDANASADVVIRYTRKEALVEGVLVPMEFDFTDGPAEYIDKKGKQKIDRISTAKRAQESAAVIVSLATEHALKLLGRGVHHWKQYGKKLLVVAYNQQQARFYHEELVKRGITADLAITDVGPDALKAIERFRGPDCHVLVTCAMAYEGLDVKPITHIICLTAIRSVPWLEQMFGRAWRPCPGKTQCWAFVPDDPRMKRIVERIRAEQPATVKPTMTTNGGTPNDPWEPIIPISSDLVDARPDMLDPHQSPSPDDADLQDLLQKAGVSDDPRAQELIQEISPRLQELSQIMRRSRQQASEQDGKTVTERIMNLRNQVSGLCRRYASRLQQQHGGEVDWGAPGKLLYAKTGIRFENATLEELESVAQVAAKLFT